MSLPLIAASKPLIPAPECWQLTAAERKPAAAETIKNALWFINPPIRAAEPLTPAQGLIYTAKPYYFVILNST